MTMTTKEIVTKQASTPDVIGAESNGPPSKPPILAALAPPPKPLAQNRLRLVNASSSDLQNHWTAVLPAGIAFEAALEPSFFSAHADKIKVGDVIDIGGDSRSFFGSVYVRDVSRTKILVGRLGYHEFDVLSKSTTDAPAFRTEFDGPHNKWVVKSADGKIIREGFATEEDAALAMKGLERSRAEKVG
jgi:hypothetical protein